MEYGVGNNQSILHGANYTLDNEYYIHRLFQHILKTGKVQGRIALIWNNLTMNFQDFDKKSSFLAKQLLKMIWENDLHNQRKENWIIAVWMHPSIEMIITLLAVLKVGAAYLPIDPSFPVSRISFILSDAKPMILLTHNSVLQNCVLCTSDNKSTVFLLYEDVMQEENNESEIQDSRLESNEQDLAIVLYTSGSTGIPKGVRLSHKNIIHRLHWQWKTFPYDINEVACFKTALTFVDSVAEIWAPLLQGISLAIVPKTVTQDPELFIRVLESHKITRLVLVPSLLTSILLYLAHTNNEEARLQYLHLWICSGEILSSQLLLQFFNCFNNGHVICNFYGSTEVMGDVTYAVFQSSDDVESALHNGKVPIGKPVDNCTIYVLNSTMEVVNTGEIGEICVAGSHVADGYINKNVAGNFVPNKIEKRKGHEILYRTGDFGKIVNGTLYYEGRADSQVKVRGHRVDLTEINAALNQLDQIRKGVALCYRPGEPEQEIIAYVVPNNATASSIHFSLKEKLLSYAMPRVILVEEIPLLVNGKVDRQMLISRYANSFKEKITSNEWIENEINKLTSEQQRAANVLLKTVLSALGKPLQKSIGLMDNFFDIGGNSLNAVIVVTKLKDQGFNLNIQDFLAAENFLQISRLMSSCYSVMKCRKETEYVTEMLNQDMKELVIRIVGKCFSEKGDLELLTGTTYGDYEELMTELWDPLLLANLSFAVKNEESNIVAVALNCDVFDAPSVEPKSKRLSYVFEVLEYVKAPFRERLFHKEKHTVFQNFMVVTDEKVGPAENVALIQYVEKETIKLAKCRGFKSIFTSNTNPLTQQICDDVLDYKLLCEYQVKRYVAKDGTRPFAMAPDTQYVTVSIKNI